MAVLSPVAKQQFFDNDGNPAAGFLLYTYAAGTSTPQATYTDSAGAVPNTNPIVLDSRGEATIYLDPSLTYDYVLKTAAGALIRTDPGVSAGSGDAAGIAFIQSGTGAIQRTLQAKAREVVSVTDFKNDDGTQVAGDGVQDDTTGINTAIEAVSARGGGDVVFPPGNYRVARQGIADPIIALRSNVNLIGHGGARIFNDPSVNTTNNWRMIGAPLDNTSIENVTIQGLELDGSNTIPAYTAANEQNHGIFLYAYDGSTNQNIKILDCFVHDFSGDGITLSRNTSYVVVANNTVYDCLRQGIQLGTMISNIVVADNVCREAVGSAGSSIHVEPNSSLRVPRVSIVGNVCGSPTHKGSILLGGLRDSVVVGNVAFPGGYEASGHIDAAYCENVSVIGNRCSRIVFGYCYDGSLEICGNTVETHGNYDGIYIYGVAQPTTHVSVQNNVIRTTYVGNTKSGIRMDYTKDCAVTGNLIPAAPNLFTNGILVQSSVDTSVLGNTANGSTSGIVTSATSILESGTIIDGNVCRGGTYDLRFSGGAASTGIRLGVNALLNTGVPSITGGVTFSPFTHGQKKVFHGTAAPTTGTWAAGDRSYNTAPTAGSPLGWVCVSGGTPGTWVPFGGIRSANAYTATNVTTDRAFDADTVAVAELADVVGTLIADLKAAGVLL